MIDFLLFAAGCACAAIGGELFVRGLVGIANWGRLPRGVVAATIGAFATSSPELIVGITSALEGVPEIAFGDAMGSNIVNVTLILAIPLLAFGLSATRESTVRDLPFALAIFPIVGISAVDGAITAGEALLLLAVFGVWFAFVLVWALRNRTDGETEAEDGRVLVSATAVVGLLTLFLAGQLIVEGATGLAVAAGLPPFLVGATIVALGTSVPELATVAVSSLRGHQEVGLQTILGSNIFNSLLILPVAALIHPIGVDWSTASLPLAFGFAATLLTVPLFRFRLGQWRGIALIVVYGAFIVLSFAGPSDGP